MARSLLIFYSAPSAFKEEVPQLIFWISFTSLYVYFSLWVSLWQFLTRSPIMFLVMPVSSFSRKDRTMCSACYVACLFGVGVCFYSKGVSIWITMIQLPRSCMCLDKLPSLSVSQTSFFLPNCTCYQERLYSYWSFPIWCAIWGAYVHS